jgi:hypothetical protein
MVVLDGDQGKGNTRIDIPHVLEGKSKDVNRIRKL